MGFLGSESSRTLMVLILGLGSGCARCRWREHKCETTAPAGVSSPPHPPPSPRRRLGQGVLWFSHLQGDHGLQALRGSSSALQHPELWGQVWGEGDTCDPGRWQARVGEGHGSLAWARKGSPPTLWVFEGDLAHKGRCRRETGAGPPGGLE